MLHPAVVHQQQATQNEENPFLPLDPAGMTRSTLKRTVLDNGLQPQGDMRHCCKLQVSHALTHSQRLPALAHDDGVSLVHTKAGGYMSGDVGVPLLISGVSNGRSEELSGFTKLRKVHCSPGILLDEVHIVAPHYDCPIHLCGLDDACSWHYSFSWVLYYYAIDLPGPCLRGCGLVSTRCW